MSGFDAKKDYQKLYAQLGRLLETAPEITYSTAASRPVQEWLGRAHALVEEVGVGTDAITLRSQLIPRLGTSATWPSAVKDIFVILYRALAKCELESPAAAAGAFVPVGNSFDAFTALSKILGAAKKDALIVDPYLDETALTEFGVAVPAGVSLRLLADVATHKPTLQPAAAKWVQQHGSSRPLQVRLAAAKALHDRAIFIDGQSAWTLTQSLKDFAKRAPAEIVRADDTASLKVAAYENIWSQSTVVV